MWQMVSVLAAFVVLMFLIDLLDLPDWIRAYLKKGSTRKELQQKVEALQLQVEQLEGKLNSRSE
ncbi:MAG: hypothetical protein KKE94_01835 [Gammaproteobacteria bacterium]|nr:hypothetical protein [Gammaproteobacteria bacterium]